MKTERFTRSLLLKKAPQFGIHALSAQEGYTRATQAGSFKPSKQGFSYTNVSNF